MSLDFSEPEHITADFVGQPGQRTFYLQVAEEGHAVEVLVEKQQVAGLGELLRELLADVGTQPPVVWDVDGMRLREPLDPLWRAGSIGVGIDPQLGRVVMEVTEFVPEDEAREPEQMRIWLSESQAAWLAAHADWAVQQGRPECRLCGLPMEPDGHVCPRSNGDSRARRT
jgi:uncharacterized repeat protein (TIGR03847 family)